jgi:hypothetical protein
MRQRLMMPGVLCVGFALVLGSAPARATYYTTPVQALVIPLTQTNWGTNTLSIQALNPFVVKKFDPLNPDPAHPLPSGQTAVLFGITVALGYEFDNTPTMTFKNVATLTVNTVGAMNMYLPDGKTNVVVAPTFSNIAQQVSTTADTFPKSVTLSTQKTTAIVSGSYVDTATLAQFIGSKGATISLPVFAQATTTFTSSSGNGTGSAVTFAGAQINLVYFYTLVPEPTSFVLMGLGLTGLIVVAGNRTRFGLKKLPAA